MLNQRLYPVRQSAWLACSRPLDLRCRVLFPEDRLQVIVAVPHFHRADAPLGRADEQPPELRVDDCVADAHSEHPAAVGGGRHAERGPRRLVQTAARAIACIVEGTGNVAAVAQPVLQPLDAAGGGVLPRRDAQRPSEHAL